MAPHVFLRAVMVEYERRWLQATGHGVRHPLRLKMNSLAILLERSFTPDELDATLEAAAASDDPGAELLADELLPLWRSIVAGGSLPFGGGR